VKTENVKYVASKRFVDEKKNPVAWEIRAITSVEDEALRKAATKRVPVVGRRGQYTADTDFNDYVGKLAASCTVFPNLNDAELQNSYGAMSADQLLKVMLTPGEYAQYLGKIQEVNGFDATFEDEVDEAKN
ncbi:MAG: phage portal protein, partial [Oscillospiraceae bacterium]|jgi:hypothetical protein|nr:phage portal protein [Oscillospiraceae bacterium]